MCICLSLIVVLRVRCRRRIADSELNSFREADATTAELGAQGLIERCRVDLLRLQNREKGLRDGEEEDAEDEDDVQRLATRKLLQASSHLREIFHRAPKEGDEVHIVLEDLLDASRHDGIPLRHVEGVGHDARASAPDHRGSSDPCTE